MIGFAAFKEGFDEISASLPVLDQAARLLVIAGPFPQIPEVPAIPGMDSDLRLPILQEAKQGFAAPRINHVPMVVTRHHELLGTLQKNF